MTGPAAGRPPAFAGATRRLDKACDVAALAATHNMEIAAQMDRRVTLREERVVEVG